MTDVAERVAAVRARLADAARRAGRDPESVTLVGVTKRQPIERIGALVAAGVCDLGENYVQEARAKTEALAEAAPRWHLIGRLQRNKAREAVALFASVESVDRVELARELARRAEQAERRLPVLIQVNVSDEPQKGGVAPAALPGLVEACQALPALELRGLMAIPAAAPTPEANRAAFARVRELAAQIGDATLPELSMGMSGDFEIAVEEGATRVRVGTALLGPRGE
ncbi:MAG: YggS family pyridoxal phosphate-dependent enzyme [Proteobacteria bacterium]|nr:YggS family pyridoxal phosphate-dependent enzyme [Pseudomonadota bacterium]